SQAEKGYFSTFPWGSAPRMFRIALLEFFLQVGIGLSPETGEILRDLHWSLVGGQDLDNQWLPSHGNDRCLCETVEILDAGRQHGRGIRSIANTGAVSTRQRKPFWGVGVKQVFLPWGQPGLEHRPDGLVLDLLSAKAAKANLLQEKQPFFC